MAAPLVAASPPHDNDDGFDNITAGIKPRGINSLQIIGRGNVNHLSLRSILSPPLLHRTERLTRTCQLFRRDGRQHSDLRPVADDV
jgi:hypothetical protein